MVYRELITSYRRDILQSQYNSPDTQLSQGTKPSKETPGNSTVSSVIENSETKTPNDIYDTPIIATDTINQDVDVANRTVSSIEANSHTKTLNDTCNKSVITTDTIN